MNNPTATPVVHLVLRPSGHIRTRRLGDSEIVQDGDYPLPRDVDPSARECIASPVSAIGKRAGDWTGLWFYRPM